MMRIAMSVKYADGSGADVVAKAPDLIAFESHFNKPMGIIADEPRITYIMWLAWTTLKRTKQTTDEFEAWTESVDEIKVGETAELPPLESAATPIG